MKEEGPLLENVEEAKLIDSFQQATQKNEAYNMREEACCFC
jgi:hypothetical protein